MVVKIFCGGLVVWGFKGCFGSELGVWYWEVDKGVGGVGC